MSDLQCPARLYVGSPRAAADVERWRGVLAFEGAVDVVDLRGGPAAASELGEVADVRRGEAVLVLVDLGTPYLGEDHELVALSVDGDGISRTPWVPLDGR